MLTLLLVGIFGMAVGFGLGRIKNEMKLAQIQDEIMKVEHSTVSEVAALVLAIKSKL